MVHSLSAEREVIAIDLPGHGASPPEPDSGTFAGLVGSVQRFITESGLADVDLVGSSMGARIVLELARRGSGGNVVALDPGGFWRGWVTADARTPPHVPDRPSDRTFSGGDIPREADERWLECEWFRIAPGADIWCLPQAAVDRRGIGALTQIR